MNPRRILYSVIILGLLAGAVWMFYDAAMIKKRLDYFDPATDTNRYGGDTHVGKSSGAAQKGPAELDEAFECLPPQLIYGPVTMLDMSDLVFRGRLNKYEDIKGGSIHAADAIYDVSDVYKGNESQTVIIKTNDRPSYVPYYLCKNNEVDNQPSECQKQFETVIFAVWDSKQKVMREKCEGRLNSGFWWNSNDKTQMFADMEKIASFDGNGLLILNHANGQLKYELSYKNHKLDGISKAYYENEKVKSQVNYVNGIAQGHAEFLGEDGRLTETAEYADGFKVLSKIHIYGTEGVQIKRECRDGKLYKEWRQDDTGKIVRETDYSDKDYECTPYLGLPEGLPKRIFKMLKVRPKGTNPFWRFTFDF